MWNKPFFQKSSSGLRNDFRKYNKKLCKGFGTMSRWPINFKKYFTVSPKILFPLKKSRSILLTSTFPLKNWRSVCNSLCACAYVIMPADICMCVCYVSFFLFKGGPRRNFQLSLERANFPWRA